MNEETKVGLFVLTGLVIFVIGIMFLGDVHLQSRYRLNVMFDNIQGLPDKGSVKISGVEVGRVDTISLERGRARVNIWIKSSVPVYSDATAAIQTTGIVGSKYLELSPGTQGTPRLKDGATIEGRTGLSINDVMFKLAEVFEPKVPGGPTFFDDLHDTLTHVNGVAAALDEAIGRQGAAIGDALNNFHDISINLKSFSRTINRIGVEQEGDIKEAITNIRSVSGKLNTLLARVEKGEGAVGKLVSDKDVGEDVKTTLSSLKSASASAEKVMGRIALIETYWDVKLRQDTGIGHTRVDAGIKIAPRPGKYYYLGGANLGSRVGGLTDSEKRNTITAVMGKDFGDLTLYGGVLRSGGGGGFSYRPLAISGNRSKLELNAEAYDFGRDKVLRGRLLDHPVYNAGVRYMALPWAWVWMGVEDMAEFGSFVTSVNVSFKDEDLGYLLGFIGLAKP